MPQSIKPPAACSAQELESFKSMLLASEQEGEDGLLERIAQAELLAFHYADDKLVAVAALKHPKPGYTRGIFKKAGLAEQAENYLLEFGWAFILNEYSRRGIGSGLLTRLLQRAGTQNIFAITRSSDKSMAESLERRGFVAAGVPYTRRGHRYSYQLYLRAGQAAAVTAPDTQEAEPDPEPDQE